MKKQILQLSGNPAVGTCQRNGQVFGVFRADIRVKTSSFIHSSQQIN